MMTIPAQSPKISIVTPTYNCGKYIRVCIESVLAQGYDNFEHIIVDGASKDDTVEILKQYPHLKWISESDSGEAEALNKALNLATGDILNWLNADDCYLGKNVFHSVAAEFAGPAPVRSPCDAVYGKALITNDADDVLGIRMPRVPLDLTTILRWFADIHLSQPALFYTRELAQKVGPYREDLYFSIDYDYWLRMAAAGCRFRYLDRVLAQARLVRSGAKSSHPRVIQEKNWQEIATPYVQMLSPGERFGFWKSFFAYRITQYHRYNESLSAPDDPYAMSALCVALLETNQTQAALTAIQDFVNRYPKNPDALFLASEALHKVGRSDDARRIAAQGFAVESSLPPAHPAPAPAPAVRIPPIPQQKLAPRVRKSARLGRALLCFPHNPIPARSGAHQRFLAIAEGLQNLGYDVSLFSSTLSSESPWTIQSIQVLERELDIGVQLHEASAADFQYVQQVDAAGANAPFGARQVPPSMLARFRQVFAQSRPDLAMVSYSHFGGLLAGQEFASAIRVMDMLDMVTLNARMQAAVWTNLGKRYQGQFGPGDVPAAFLQKNFYETGQFAADPAEYAMLDRYDYTLAIAAHEGQLVQQHAPRTKVLHVPVSYAAEELDNSYDGQPLFMAGPNIFNVQGYLYFAARILPEVLRESPDFHLRVAGDGCKWLKPAPATSLLGFVPDIRALYASAPFAICPLIGGTGQQIKVVEAMARGVPVICLRNVAASSPIEHGKNGLIAEDAADFARCALALWRDRSLCRTLGQAARETVAREYSPRQLQAQLKTLAKFRAAA